MESLTLDREVAHLKDELMPRYAKLIYNGYWWAPERLALQALIDRVTEARGERNQLALQALSRASVSGGSVSAVS